MLEKRTRATGCKIYRSFSSGPCRFRRLFVLALVTIIFSQLFEFRSIATSSAEQGTNELAKTISALIIQLADKQYAVRERASTELREIGLPALAALEEAKTSDDPELAIRAREILADVRMGIKADWPPKLARQARNMDALNFDNRIEVMRKALAALGDRALPFILTRIAQSEKNEASQAAKLIRERDSRQVAEQVLQLVNQPATDDENRICGWAYFKLGRTAEAMAVLSDVPDDDGTFNRAVKESIEQVIALLHTRQSKTAGEKAERYAAAVKDDARFLYLQSVALKAQGRKKAADDIARKALALHPDSEAKHYTVGEMLTDEGWNELAVREWKKILDIPPAEDVYDINAYFRLGKIFARLGRFTEAADYKEKGLAAYRAGKQAGQGYGMIGAKVADIEKHIRSLRKKAWRDGKITVRDEKGRRLSVKLTILVKDGKELELRKALQASDLIMHANVKPRGIRLLDLKVGSIAYDKEKKEITVTLNGASCSDPVKLAANMAKAKIAVKSLDCIYIYDLDMETGFLQKTARYEYDYELKFEPEEALHGYRSQPIKLGKKKYQWDELLKGLWVDWLPDELEIKLEEKSGKDFSTFQIQFKDLLSPF